MPHLKVLLMRTFHLFCLPILLLQLPGAFAASREPVRAKHGMVASTHRLASEIGTNVLKRGGNAVDAAVATALALAVVYPQAGNLGGGGFMLLRVGNRSTVIDYRETAPQAASRNMFLNAQGEPLKGEGSSTIGYRAVGVPGTVAGLELALKKYGSGKFTWTQLVEPARKLAQNGFGVSPRLMRTMREETPLLARYSESKRIFLRNGKPFEWGETFRQPQLAATLARLQKNGPREFYTGETARLIAADMKKHKGLITLDDLKSYQPKERAPLRGSYRGHTVLTMPPPSSGGAVLLHMLNILEGHNVRAMNPLGSQRYHLLVEAMRRGFADRAVWFGDPDFVKVPIAQLVSKTYATQRARGISLDRAASSENIKAGNFGSREKEQTTHFTIVDAAGNVVSNTYTLNGWFGSGVTAAGTGVLLNNEMDDFTAKPGTANMFGVIQGERNAVQAGKRPLSSMTPTIVLRKNGSPWFAVGARGGPRIITAVLQTVINMIDHDMHIQAAIDAPRIHHQWFPDEILSEPHGLSPDTRNILEKFGHNFAAKPANIASATGIEINEKGVRLGAIDSRSDGEAIGF